MTLADANQLDDMYRLTPKVAKLCKPLFDESPIAFYCYYEFRPDGTMRYLASHQRLFERLIEKRFWDYPLVDPTWGFTLTLDYFMRVYTQAGFSLQDLKPGTRFELPILQSLEFGHACAFIENSNDPVVRFHYFLGYQDDDSVNDFNLNNTNLLTYFSRYMSKHAGTLLKSTGTHPLPHHILQTYGDWMQRLNTHPSINIPHFLSSYAPHIVLSKQQRQLIYWYMMGKTTDETATILGLTRNTVNCYFDRIKRRFGCGSKPQIIAELLKNGVCFPELPENERFI